VQQLVEEILRHWPGRWENRAEAAAPLEARLLHLSTAKAQQQLGWRPRWRLAEAVAKTVAWQRDPAPAPEKVKRQIAEYSAAG
jgi:CDP-glucose 4,6-dehydratase